MARSARLLALLQALRGRRRPAAASALADERGVSLRTIYRDIAALTAEVWSLNRLSSVKPKRRHGILDIMLSLI